MPYYAEIKIDLNGVMKLLSNLKPNKAAGPDSIKPLVLKQLKMETAPVICLLSEKTLQTGQLPSDWKKAQVCPLFKKGNKTEPSYYRPISLTTMAIRTTVVPIRILICTTVMPIRILIRTTAIISALS